MQKRLAGGFGDTQYMLRKDEKTAVPFDRHSDVS